MKPGLAVIQNEEIFVRFMNDEAFQKIVTAWMASEAYRRLRQTACFLAGDRCVVRRR